MSHIDTLGEDTRHYAGNKLRREEILNATCECLSEFGYHGTSLRDVARRVGISHPGVIYHFPNKEALVMAVVQRHDNLLNFDRFNTTSTVGVGKALRSLDYLTDMTKSPFLIETEVTLGAEAASQLHPAHEYCCLRQAEILKRATRLYDEINEQGFLRSNGLTTRQIATLACATWQGLQVQWLIDRKRPIVEELRSLMRVFIDFDGYQATLNTEQDQVVARLNDY